MRTTQNETQSEAVIKHKRQATNPESKKEQLLRHSSSSAQHKPLLAGLIQGLFEIANGSNVLCSSNVRWALPGEPARTPKKGPPNFSRKLVVCIYGLLWLIYGLLYGIVASCFGLLGFWAPGPHEIQLLTDVVLGWSKAAVDGGSSVEPGNSTTRAEA